MAFDRKRMSYADQIPISKGRNHKLSYCSLDFAFCKGDESEADSNIRYLIKWNPLRTGPFSKFLTV